MQRQKRASVQGLETRVAELTSRLQDPELYTHSVGVADARRLGAELEELKRRLDSELEAWTAATDALSALVATHA